MFFRTIHFIASYPVTRAQKNFLALLFPKHSSHHHRLLLSRHLLNPIQNQTLPNPNHHTTPLFTF